MGSQVASRKSRREPRLKRLDAGFESELGQNHAATPLWKCRCCRSMVRQEGCVAYSSVSTAASTRTASTASTSGSRRIQAQIVVQLAPRVLRRAVFFRSEEHTSELQS